MLTVGRTGYSAKKNIRC